MGTHAGADVVGADAHETEGGTGIFGELAEVHLGWDVIAVDKLDGDIHVGVDYLVDFILDGLDLMVGWCGVEYIVALAFLLLDVGVARALATEHLDHCGVQNMLRRMHGREFLFVVSVKCDFFFHVRITDLSV